MKRRLIEVYSSITEEFLCDFCLDEFWTVDQLCKIIKIDDNDIGIHGLYRLSNEQVLLLGGQYLLNINDSNVEFFLSYC